MIEELENGMLDNLVSVTHLYIRKCHVTTIGENAFQNMFNLEYLDMSMNQRLGFDQLFKSFCSLPTKIESLILNKVTTRSSRMCGNAITKENAKCIEKKPVRELQLNHNVIYYIEPGVFSIFPKTLQVIGVNKNEFHLGIYMFFIFYLTNLTMLDMSYQFFEKPTSIWHNNHGNVEFDDTHSTHFLKDKYIQGDYNLARTLNNYIYHRTPDNLNDFEKLAGDRLSDQSTSLPRNRLKPSTSLSQNKNPNFQTTERTCPQFDKEHYIPPGTLLVNIPPNLKYLDVSHSKNANPIFELFINETNQLENINASNSLFYCWDGPVHGLSKLKVLDLSNNFCTDVSKHFFETLINLRQLNISFNFLGTALAKDRKGQIIANLTRLEILDLSFNLIDKLPDLFLKSQTELQILIAKVNMMQEFNIDINHMTKLRKLDIKSNKIATLSKKIQADLELISKSGEPNVSGPADVKLFVDLRGNPLECSCDNLQFIKWLSKYYVSSASLSINVSHCLNYESHLKREELTSQYKVEEMVHYLETQCRSFTHLIVGLSITLAIIINIILGSIVHRFRWKIQYWYYVVLNRKTGQGRGGYELIDEPRYKYDVFVASSDDQKDIVIDKLRPVFIRNGLTAFIAVYHINFNDNLVNIISKAIYESKVILFVFSNDWSVDHCMNVAVHMWQCDMVERKRREVLGIFLTNMNGADAYKTKDVHCSTFIDFPRGGDEDEIEAFWTDCVDHIKDQGTLQ